MIARVLGGTLALGLLLLGAACEEDETTSSSGGGTCDATLASVSAIFNESCTQAGCHDAAEPAVGLDLESAGVEARLLDQAAATCARTLVVPGNAELSFLYEKLTTAAPECGGTMPVGGSLSDEQIRCVGDWIASLPSGCETCGGSGCADLQQDPSNCGGCDVICPAGATCEAGSCVCSGAEMACGDICVDTTSNPEHCGECGKRCNGMLVCSLSQCKNDCDGGLMNCGGACVDTQADANHCGGCDVDCGATGSCDAGTCDCGAGIDPQTDPNNCGTCGNVCPPGQTCELGACACGSASVSFSSAIQPILTANCATIGCHRQPMPKEGLDLSSGNAHAGLVNVVASQCNGRLRVVPGDPAESYMVDKILGVDLCFGTKMPKMGSLSTTDIEAISNWICAGAPND